MVNDIFFDLQRFAGIDADNAKWDEIDTIGGDTDPDATHHGKVYDTFYNLENTDSDKAFVVAAESSVGFLNDDGPELQTVSSVINITGQYPLGTPEVLGAAAHVTLSTGSGESVGAVPVNIQANENSKVVDVEVNLASSSYPSTVAVGTNGAVTASHTIQLSNAGGYGYLGAGATGQNVLAAGTAGAMLRHDGTERASVIGGAGNDSIRAAQNDYVFGGGGSDLFYDTNAYAIQDYDPTADAIIATGLTSIDEVNIDNVSGTGNQIGFGTGEELTIANKDASEAIQVKVAVMDDDGNVTADRKDVVVANSNGVVSAATASTNALVIANSLRGAAVNMVVGSAQDDQIYIGNNDYVDGGTGNDYITIDKDSTGVGVALAGTGGTDTVENWVFGFNTYPNQTNNGATKLEVGDAAFQGRVVEDRLQISVTGGGTMVFEDTKALGEKHGQFDVLIGTDSGDKKYTAIRDGGYALITSNEEVADYYLSDNSNISSEDDTPSSPRSYGFVQFTANVTEDLGVMDLSSDKFNAIRDLRLYNNSHATVIGSSARETVRIGGEYEASASKNISLGGDNDVIVSSGDEGTGNTFYFGAGDGRDTIHSFGHYLGVDTDPEKQKADKLYLGSFTGLRVDVSDTADRVVFNTSANDDVVIYETDKLDINNKMYQVEIEGFGAKIAKIGYSDTANNFTYDREVSYYVGSSGNARDTLTIGNEIPNVNLWLDGSQNGGEFYRGVGVVDASAETNTNIAIAGSADNNTIIGGGEGTYNTLWGGAGDNSLVGGAGVDDFRYYQGSATYINGAAGQTVGSHDTIEGYDAENDIIFLGDITIDDINEAAMVQSGNLGIGENAVTVEFKNGGSLTVNGTSNVSFIMSDGTSNHGDVYTANRESGQWEKA